MDISEQLRISNWYRLASLGLLKMKTITVIVAVLFANFMIGESKMTESNSRKCIDDTNKRFASLFQDIFSTKNYDLIGWLKCIYLDLVDVKSNDTLPCETERTTQLRFKNATILREIKDLNKKEDVALQRYSQLLSDFITSLADVEAFERNVTSRKSFVSMVKNVTKWLMEIQEKMKVIAKDYKRCYQEIFNSTLRIIPDGVILSFNDPGLPNYLFTEEERAGALFKQLQIALRQIKDEFSYRKKCFCRNFQ